MNKPISKNRLSLLLFTSLLLFSCVSTPSTPYLDYALNPPSYQETIKEGRNHETFEELASIYQDDSILNLKYAPFNQSPSDDFIKGVDLSSIYEVEKNGGAFYNKLGEEQDIFEILRSYSVNYLRVRLWNDPSDLITKLPYGGGNNNLATNLEILKRAARVGMKICLDFHYSDFWADPGHQVAPKAWVNSTFLELENHIYTYTFETLKYLEKRGVRPHMVQLGNEINNGMAGCLVDYKSPDPFKPLSNLLKAASKAVKDISPNIQTVIHLGATNNIESLKYFLDNMVNLKVPFDIIGLSYYPFWHGSITSFQKTMTYLTNSYSKPVAIMEYSYGFTLKSDPNSVNIFNDELAHLGSFKPTFQGQIEAIEAIFRSVINLKNNMGLGAFYFEPSWLPIKGVGWAEEGAKDYFESNGIEATNLGKVSWSNQSLFSYSGKVLPSLEVFKNIIPATKN